MYDVCKIQWYSNSNKVMPKVAIFWKWRNGGADADYMVERSPLTQPVNKPVVRDEDKSSLPEDMSFSRLSNKREDTCTKMGEREMVRQVGMNPFLRTDYVKGIEIRDKFLVPFHESKPAYDQDS